MAKAAKAAREKAAREKAAREKAAREKAAREQEFAETATAQGLAIGTQIHMEWKGDVVVVEVAKYENAEKIACRYPDGRNRYPAGGSIDGVVKAWRAAWKRSETERKEKEEREAARVSFFFFFKLFC